MDINLKKVFHNTLKWQWSRLWCFMHSEPRLSKTTYLGACSLPNTPSHRGVYCCSCSSRILFITSVGLFTSVKGEFHIWNPLHNTSLIFLSRYFIMFIIQELSGFVFWFNQLITFFKRSTLLYTVHVIISCYDYQCKLSNTTGIKTYTIKLA